MEMVLLGLLVGGELWFIVYGFSVLVSWAFVLPKVHRLNQSMTPWAVACLAFPLITAFVVNSKVD